MALTRAVAQVSTRQQIAESYYEAELVNVERHAANIRERRKHNHCDVEDARKLVEAAFRLASQAARVTELRMLIEQLQRGE